MTGGDADELVVVESSFDKNFRDRLTVVRQVVIPERACLIGVLEEDELPIGRLGLSRDVEIHRVAPNRDEILIVAGLQRRNERV